MTKKRAPGSKKRARALSEREKEIRRLKARLAKLSPPKAPARRKRKGKGPAKPHVPAKKRRSGPKPRLPALPSRERSDRERAKAYRLRNRLARGEGLTSAQSAWLDRYEHAVSRGKRAKHARSTLAKNRGAKGDAVEIAERVAEWFGDAGAPVEASWQRKPAPGVPGTANATVDLDYGFDRKARSVRAQLPEGSPDLGGTLGPDRAMTLRVEIKVNRKKRWATAVAFTERTWDAEADFVDAVDDIVDAYGADAVTAVAVYVSNFA